jgi:predicted O-methyltransferase YrrM
MIYYENWFKQKSEEYFGVHLQDFKNKDNLKFLQIGVYTGDGSIWLVDNLLTGQNCTLTDVERWELDSDRPQQDKDYFADVEKTYDEKVKNYTNIIKHKMASADFFPQNTEMYDFIYLDGDKSAEGRYQDAISAWQTLKPNGLLVCDDATYVAPAINANPFVGLNQFLTEMSGQYTLIHQDQNHTLIQKRI